MAFYRPRDPLKFHSDKQVAGCARSCTSCCLPGKESLPGKEMFYLFVYPADVVSVISTVDASTFELADTLDQLIIFKPDEASRMRGAGLTPLVPVTCRALRHPLAARTEAHGLLFIGRFYVSMYVATRMGLDICVGLAGTEKMKMVFRSNQASGNNY